MATAVTNKRTIFFYSGIFIFLVFLLSTTIWLVSDLFISKTNSKYSDKAKIELLPAIDNKKAENKNGQINNKLSKKLIEAATVDDTTVNIIHVSSREGLKVPYEEDRSAGKRYRKVFTGRRINIAVTGVDSRLGSRYKHADANHVISILIDSGYIEITAIPRDTEADCGFDDSTGQNKLTVLRAVKGRSKYLKEVAKIAGLDRIHYYVEFGFSQAMGILEWLGYEDSGSTLQVLRSRHGLGGDDFQRSYNQAQFIRQMILKHFDKFTGLLGGLFIRGGLALVETNLTASKASEIIGKLDKLEFPADPDVITVKVRPPIGIRFKKYDFTDKEVISQLKQKVENYHNEKENGKHDSVRFSVANFLREKLDRALLDSAKNPALIINRLKTYFDQKAWLQIPDKKVRFKIREDFCILLSDAYKKKKQDAKAENVINEIIAEKKLFGEKGREKNPDTTAVKNDVLIQ